jgi:hypothetical protein
MIDAFRSSFTEGLAEPSRFKVIITPPAQLLPIMGPELLSFRCEAAVLPGRNLSTTEMRIYGPTEKFPYQSAYDDVTLTFICTEHMEEKKFFDDWLNMINPLNSWNFKYKKHYATDIEIRQYTFTDEVSYSISLIDAFPISVNDLQLEWSEMNGYHKLSVTFAYTYWEAKGHESNEESDVHSEDQQVASNIPSLLMSNPNTQLQGTYLDITNQAIGPFDTIKDQYASRTNAKNQRS